MKLQKKNPGSPARADPAGEPCGGTVTAGARKSISLRKQLQRTAVPAIDKATTTENGRRVTPVRYTRLTHLSRRGCPNGRNVARSDRFVSPSPSNGSENP